MPEFGIVLGLAEQVAGHERRVGLVVGDDEDLGRPGEQVDAAAAEQLPLGLGDEPVAGPAQHVDRLDLAHAERHEREGGDSPEGEDAVGAGRVDGVDRGRVPAGALDRRGAGHDRRHARDLRGDDAHLRGTEHRVASAGDVAADVPHREVPVAEDDPGADLHLERPHRGELGLGEGAHVGLAPLGVRPGLLVERRARLVDVGPGELEGRRVPPVELPAVLAHRVHAAALQREEHLGDRGRGLAVLLEQPVAARLHDQHRGNRLSRAFSRTPRRTRAASTAASVRAARKAVNGASRARRATVG